MESALTPSEDEGVIIRITSLPFMLKVKENWGVFLRHLPVQAVESLSTRLGKLVISTNVHFKES
jgi:hypothetical protein